MLIIAATAMQDAMKLIEFAPPYTRLTEASRSVGLKSNTWYGVSLSTGIWPLLELGKEWATLDSKFVVFVFQDPSISIRPSSPRLSLN